MSKYKRNERWTVRVPHPYGGVVEKAIGTGDETTAKHYETMCAMLLAHPMDHVFLVAVCAGNLPIRTLYSHWVRKTLPALRAEVTDLDLAPHVTPWRNLLAREYGEPTMSAHTARQYPDQVGWFFEWAGATTLSQLTPQKVTLWMASRGVSSSRQRRYWAALKSFVGYLEKMRVIETDPLAKLEPPTANDPRTRHLTPAERERLIAACEDESVRTAEVLAHMGLEVSAILATRARDVDLKDRTVYAHGTKHVRGRQNYRDRQAHIPDWALSYLKDALRFKHPDALLVSIKYGALRRAHYAACKAAKISEYRLHDGRHTYAVYMKRAGTPSEVIGLQLGHKDGAQVERVYGVYKPKSTELAHWAEVAEAHHKKRGAR